MSATPVRWAAPRIVRNHLTKRLKENSYQLSPQDILSRFPDTTRLTVKQSIAANRFFMYEEHSPAKIQDDDPMTPTITTSPMELASLLPESSSSSSPKTHHYYWTSPVSTVAPNLLQEEFDWYQQLHHYDDDDDSSIVQQQLLDPRGPSLWMGTFGSGTQCHYDVAHNVILQLYGRKRIRCFPPHVGVSHLHVFPDAHPRARKSQVNLDTEPEPQYPHFSNPPAPFLDITLQPGEALEIPAFWFHHVENGLVGNSSSLPSVSLNSFVLSESMMIAQQIFQKASQYTRYTTMERAPCILRGLGLTLITRLGLVANREDALEFIQRNLLQARYAPLVMVEQNKDDDDESPPESSVAIILTEEEQQAIETCVQAIRADFDDLVMEGIDEKDNVDENGIVLLVALHLLELWAVQMVGAHSVHDVWKKALHQ